MPPLPPFHNLHPLASLTSNGKMGVRALAAVVVVILVLLSGRGSGSEFPDRECCDSAPPPPPHYHTVTSTSTTTTTTTPQPPTYGGGPEQQEKQILNCLLAKQLCEEDSNCSAILKVIPTLCGPELVACSTVTVSRCQAALRTLVQFSWFQPTCLCREPRLDPQCNAFRDLLFDHPCVFVSRKEVDMHPLQYIPTCQLASAICEDNPWCQQRLDMFRSTCQFRGGQCRNSDKEDCLRAWLQLRETPLLGCICPDGKDKKCTRLYSLVNENPCVGERYPGRVAAMSRVAAALELPLSKAVPVPTAAATHLIISSSQADPLFPLSTIHHYLQHLPVTKADHNVSLEQLKYLAGTCQSALEDCMAEPGCRSYLQLLGGHCVDTKCHREACMSSIQDIYKYLLETNQELALKIALCVCRKHEGREEEGCRSAQRRLHPPCAEATDSPSVSQCHNLGRDCRGDRVCRYRLEHYELSCAADTVTGRCAGHHRECTKAMLGLLGTDLHTNCVCKGIAFQDINQCLAWKRLIWGNPCVVEAQLTYHLRRLGFKVDILAPVFMEEDEADNHNHVKEKNFKHIRGRGGGRDNDEDDHNDNDIRSDRSDDQNDVNVEANDGTRLQARKVASSAPGDHTPPHAAPAGPTTTSTTTTTTTPTTTTTTTTTTTSPTTTTIPTTTLPERYCEVRRPGDSRSYIIEEGSSMRLYNEGDQECSELCFCELHERTKCKVLECLENRPCETSYAVYNHNAPAYQAKRGECVCYSGDFICQRPKEEEFELPTGLFLLLGFSKTEEALLRNVTGTGALEALAHLQLLFRSIAADMGEDCLLELLQHTEDNLVLQVRHLQVTPGPTNASYSNYMQMEERDRCEKPVEKVAAMFRRRAARIHHDVSLSLFVLAEVIDNVPNPQRISNGQSSLGGAGLRASWWAWLVGAAVVLAASLEASHHTGVAVAS